MNPIVSQFNIWRYFASAGLVLETDFFNQKGLFARCESFSFNENSWSSIMFAFNHPLKNIIQIIMPLIFFGFVYKESSVKNSSYQRTLKHNSYSWRKSSLASLISPSFASLFEKKIESFILILGQSVWSLLFNFSLWDGEIMTRTWRDYD